MLDEMTMSLSSKYCLASAMMLATSPADPQAAVEQLLAQHFSAEEVPGARAYDQQQRR